MTLGFIVGKFYPPHKGHKYLIETARKQVDKLVVLIAAHPTQTISGELRKKWLEEIHPDCDIRLVPDELEDDSQQWAEFTIKYLGRAPDVVFTSENYGTEYAKCMGCRHVLVDLNRKVVPISGTKVRAHPLDHLEMLEPCVRAHFVKRISIIGAESTGKTTLAAGLAKHFQTTWVPEYGREYSEKKYAGLTVEEQFDQKWRSDEFIHIAQTQQDRENIAARTANRILICDTNSFATGTWHERYVKSRHPEVDAIGAADKVDLYLLLAPDVAFIQDGFRDGEKIRNWMHQRFLDQLQSSKTPWHLISGSYEERLSKALAVLGPFS